MGVSVAGIGGGGAIMGGAEVGGVLEYPKANGGDGALGGVRCKTLLAGSEEGLEGLHML